MYQSNYDNILVDLIESLYLYDAPSFSQTVCTFSTYVIFSKYASIQVGKMLSILSSIQ